jgi:hypothetical protein
MLCDGCNEQTPRDQLEACVRYYCRSCSKLLDLDLILDRMVAPKPADPITETWPDLPPITDEQGYQSCLAYASMLENRGVTGDTRTEHGMLLLKLRRAAKLYEQSIQTRTQG